MILFCQHVPVGLALEVRPESEHGGQHVHVVDVDAEEVWEKRDKLNGFHLLVQPSLPLVQNFGDDLSLFKIAPIPQV